MSTHLALKQNCLIGILVFHIAKVGDAKEIFKEKIPWNSFVMIGGCCMIVNCANDLGIIDFLSHAMASSIPAFLIPAFVVLICALLSFVSNMFAIVPMFAPTASGTGGGDRLKPRNTCGLHDMRLQRHRTVSRVNGRQPCPDRSQRRTAHGNIQKAVAHGSYCHGCNGTCIASWSMEFV